MRLIAPEAWEAQGIEDLEPAAWRGLRDEGSVAVIAGPGAGKTEFLAQKATYLLQTGLCPSPKQILAISFKRDAADNLLQRVRKRCPSEQARRFTSITFDAFTKGLVDRFAPAVPERWRPARPYALTFPKKRDYDDFLTRTRLEAPATWQAEIAGLPSMTFEARYVGSSRLQLDPPEPTTGTAFAISRWWQEQLRSRRGSLVTFIMLNRLAELLLRTRPPVLRALRATYPLVFVDEFQDTTYGQYDFLRSVFGASDAVVTAVGDDKQRIMAWAGARPNAFAKFKDDFAARERRLIFNHRSSPALVRIQHVVARALDSESPEVESKADAKIDGDVAEIWSFTDEAREARVIAEWVASDRKKRKLAQRDYALLVRQTANRFEEQFAEAFRDAGLRLRNESREVGRTNLQDLLAEDLTRLVVALFRLALQQRAPASWQLFSDAVRWLRAADPEDVATQYAIETGLKVTLKRFRKFFDETPVGPDEAQEIVARALDFLDMEAVARTYPQYGVGESLEIAAEATVLYFRECADKAESWIETLDEFEGVEQVPLMTVHKSKGLEYDTMLFVGLDDKMWWAHKPEDREGLSTFFVALSRARQRAVFTYCQTRGSRNGVSDLYDLLASAGVPERSYSTPESKPDMFGYGDLWG
jgi:superfamily I DNA/RNA helicase